MFKLEMAVIGIRACFDERKISTCVYSKCIFSDIFRHSTLKMCLKALKMHGITMVRLDFRIFVRTPSREYKKLKIPLFNFRHAPEGFGNQIKKNLFSP